MAAQKKKPSKNQTAGTRAAEKAALENRPTRHICVADHCPKPGSPILLKDLVTAVTAPKRRKLHYHRECWSTLR